MTGFYKHLAEEDAPANICAQSTVNADSITDLVHTALLLPSVEYNGINATCCKFMCQSMHAFFVSKTERFSAFGAARGRRHLSWHKDMLRSNRG